MLVDDLYLASFILSETILIANYQDGFTPDQPPFLFLKFVPLKLILQLTFCSISLAFLNI